MEVKICVCDGVAHARVYPEKGVRDFDPPPKCWATGKNITKININTF